LIIVFMNKTLKEFLTGYTTAEFKGTYKSFYDVAIAHYDWMLGGWGEGLVMVTPGETSRILKWKIGAESVLNHKSNIKILEKAFKMLDDEKSKAVFGDNMEKARELFTKMLEVHLSKVVCGKEVVAKEKKPPRNQAAQLTQDEAIHYGEAIRSAKTKLDAPEVYFDAKKFKEYEELIVKLTLDDIKVAENDEAGMKRH